MLFFWLLASLGAVSASRLPLCSPGRLIGGSQPDISRTSSGAITPVSLSPAPAPLPACIAHLAAGTTATFEFAHPDSGGMSFPLLSVPDLSATLGSEESGGASFPAVFGAVGTPRTDIAFAELDPRRFDAKDITTNPIFIDQARVDNASMSGGAALASANDSMVFLNESVPFWKYPITPLWRECGSEFVAGQRMTVSVTPKVTTVALISLGAATKGFGCYDSCMLFQTSRSCGNGAGVTVIFIVMILLVLIAAVSMWRLAIGVAPVLARCSRLRLWSTAAVAALFSAVPLATGFLKIYHRGTGEAGTLSLLIPSTPLFHIVTTLATTGSAAGLAVCAVKIEGGSVAGFHRWLPCVYFTSNGIVAGLGVAWAYFDREYTSYWYTSDPAHIMSFALPAIHLVGVVGLLATILLSAGRGRKVGESPHAEMAPPPEAHRADGTPPEMHADTPAGEF
jgi:hypothetical protein